MRRVSMLLGVCLLAVNAFGTVWNGDGVYYFGEGDSVGEALLQDTATLNMTGGTIITSLSCSGNSILNMTGGTIGVTGGLIVSGNVIANLSGGSINTISAGENAAINMTVSSYQITPNSFDGILTGYWANGVDTFSIGLRSGTLSHINFTVVPEPASCLLLLLGGSCLMKRK